MSRQKSLMVRRRVAVYVAILIVSLVANAQAVRPIGNVTPRNKTCRLFHPLAFDPGFGTIHGHPTRDAVTTKPGGPGVGWEGEGYTYIKYSEDEITNDPQMRISQLALRTGVRFWHSHCNGDIFRSEVYDSESACLAAIVAYIGDGWAANHMDMREYEDPNSLWNMYYAVNISFAGLQAHVRPVDDDSGTITFSGGCNSVDIEDGFGGREHFGYVGLSNGGMVHHDSNVLWDYMTGIRNAGNSRPAGVAYAAGTPHLPGLVPGSFSSGWGGTNARLVRRENPWDDDGKTVLTPTVAEVSPASGGDVWEGFQGFVQFDAAMDKDTIDEGLLTAYSRSFLPGVGRVALSNIAWNAAGDRLSFRVDNVSPTGFFSFTVDWLRAYDVHQVHHLNGSSGWHYPFKPSGVRPNKDNFKWFAFGGPVPAAGAAPLVTPLDRVVRVLKEMCSALESPEDCPDDGQP